MSALLARLVAVYVVLRAYREREEIRRRTRPDFTVYLAAEILRRFREDRARDAWRGYVTWERTRS